MKGVTLQQEREAILAFFGDEDICYSESALTRSELDEAIGECHCMMLYAIDRGDKEDAAYWRKMIQENKIKRRQLAT